MLHLLLGLVRGEEGYPEVVRADGRGGGDDNGWQRLILVYQGFRKVYQREKIAC